MRRPAYTERQRAMQAPGFFHAPPDAVQDDIVTITGPEARHAFTVCRLRKGEMMTVCDGAGNARDCEILSASAARVVGRTIRLHRGLGEPVAQVTIAVGIGRPQVVDWVVEKSVELGAVAIVPLQCEHSPKGAVGVEAQKRRIERWRRLALGAMKQSLRSVWPRIAEIAIPDELAIRCQDYDHAFLADPDGPPWGDLIPSNPGRRSALLIVGPEAGFSDVERRLFMAAGTQPVGLGQRRLRTETAAVAALTLLMHHLGEL